MKQQLELAKQLVLVGAFVKDYAMNHPVSEDQLKQEYSKLKTKLGDKEYSARHILVKTQEEAKAIIAQLGKKAKFEKLAEKSMDTGSAEQGGSLGLGSTEQLCFAIRQCTAQPEEANTPRPVETQYGWQWSSNWTYSQSERASL